MWTPEVIILAQGTQQRMGMARGYKQLLPLPACGDVAILARTVRQLMAMGASIHEVTLVTWATLYAGYRRDPAVPVPTTVELPQPGNSSLKGIAAYLAASREPGRIATTTVLFGDVVYSWACLQALLELRLQHGFVGTSNLSASEGELWGVSWSHEHELSMRTELADALLRHPPFDDEYQPGQMRRWVMGWRRGDITERVTKLIRAGTYVPIDDYTMDVDETKDIPLLAHASELAAEDDRQHGLLW